MFDRIHMVRIGHFKKFLKMFCRLSSLALEVAPSGHDILVRAVHFLIVVITAGGNHDSPGGGSLSPLFAALGAFLSAFTSGFGWCHPDAIEGYFSII
jgi:hypothetical protein